MIKKTNPSNQNIVYLGGKTHQGITLVEFIHPQVGGHLTIWPEPAPGRKEDWEIARTREPMSYQSLDPLIREYFRMKGIGFVSGDRYGTYTFFNSGDKNTINVCVTLDGTRSLRGTIQEV